MTVTAGKAGKRRQANANGWPGPGAAISRFQPVESFRLDTLPAFVIDGAGMTNLPFEIVSLPHGDKSVRDLGYGEVYHPVIGPREEARRLYVDQLYLADRMAEARPEPLIVWDVGLGIGANACAVLEAVQRSGGRAHLISFDKTTDAARFALNHVEALPFLAGWKEEMATLLSEGRTQVGRGSGKVAWEIVTGDFPKWVEEARNSGKPAPHAVMFDPCSPARNPEMWTGRLFRKLHGVLAPDRACALATYSRATHARVGLLLAGFYVGRGRATGSKEETTVAANIRAFIQDPLDRAWLERVKASSSAEPLTDAGYRQAALTEESLARLRTHPQFV